MSYTNQEIKEMSDEQLVHALLQLDRDIVGLRFRKFADELRNHALLKNTRRTIARIRTEQTARERSQGLGQGELVELHKGSFVAQATVVEDTGSTFGSELNDEMEEEQ
jgi:large subunit ribosomal protein L29